MLSPQSESGDGRFRMLAFIAVLIITAFIAFKGMKGKGEYLREVCKKAEEWRGIK